MTIGFSNMERTIVECETYNYKPFVGYIAPNGDLIDFTKPFGMSGHDGWDNLISNTFLKYISYIVKNTSIKKLKEEKTPKEIIESLEYKGIDEYVIRGNKDYSESIDDLIKEIDWILGYKKENSRIDRFIYQLLLFYKNAYINNTFFETINKKIEVISESDFMLKNKHLQSESSYNQQIAYLNYLKKQLMSYFKDIAVCYLRYDSIEKFINGEIIKVPHNNNYISCFNPYSTYFWYTPRTITTSYPNINERFFNFQIMDWSIHKMPRYTFNKNTLKYEEEPDYYDFLFSKREEIYEKEIKAIKRLVPLKERHKYLIE